MIVIGLHGYAQSGKDTACKILQEELANRRVVRDAFADRLKLSAMAALGYRGYSDEKLIEIANVLKDKGDVYVMMPDKWNKRKYPVATISGREYLQFYGTEAHRDIFGTDFWLDAVLPMSERRNDADVLVVTDVRFPNEAQRVKDYGGYLWHIKRESVIPENTHASEAGLDPSWFDIVIDNDQGIPELREAVKESYFQVISKGILR